MTDLANLRRLAEDSDAVVAVFYGAASKERDVRADILALLSRIEDSEERYIREGQRANRLDERREAAERRVKELEGLALDCVAILDDHSISQADWDSALIGLEAKARSLLGQGKPAEVSGGGE